VLAGPFAAIGSTVIDPITRSLMRTAHPAVGPTTPVVMSQLGERSEALGAASLALARSLA